MTLSAYHSPSRYFPQQFVRTRIKAFWDEAHLFFMIEEILLLEITLQMWSHSLLFLLWL